MCANVDSKSKKFMIKEVFSGFVEVYMQKGTERYKKRVLNLTSLWPISGHNAMTNVAAMTGHIVRRSTVNFFTRKI